MALSVDAIKQAAKTKFPWWTDEDLESWWKRVQDYLSDFNSVVNQLADKGYTYTPTTEDALNYIDNADLNFDPLAGLLSTYGIDTGYKTVAEVPDVSPEPPPEAVPDFEEPLGKPPAADDSVDFNTDAGEPIGGTTAEEADTSPLIGTAYLPKDIYGELDPYSAWLNKMEAAGYGGYTPAAQLAKDLYQYDKLNYELDWITNILGGQDPETMTKWYSYEPQWNLSPALWDTAMGQQSQAAQDWRQTNPAAVYAMATAAKTGGAFNPMAKWLSGMQEDLYNRWRAKHDPASPLTTEPMEYSAWLDQYLGGI